MLNFGALQRAEIAEILIPATWDAQRTVILVLFNEPKLLKWDFDGLINAHNDDFGALQRAEIAEIAPTCLADYRRI